MTQLKRCMNLLFPSTMFPLVKLQFVFIDNVPFGEVAMAPPSLKVKPKKAQAKSPVSCSVSLSCWRMLWNVYSLLSFCPLDGTEDAAAQLTSWPHRRLHKQAVHGPPEDDGGGEGARGEGLPHAEKTETGAARPDSRSWKIQEPFLTFSKSEKLETFWSKSYSLNVWRNWFATGVGPARIM